MSRCEATMAASLEFLAVWYDMAVEKTPAASGGEVGVSWGLVMTVVVGRVLVMITSTVSTTFTLSTTPAPSATEALAVVVWGARSGEGRGGVQP